ncbi:hypothetical protein HPB48_001549 [Haemaphysalis longicornis]|uniref:Tudor domain-containing protein n=1 Tax=Haemaphysalis longicornis TaxID=44386 RepID=A0A9J6FEN5_HAELO|nr:hypothetical protein HPB48_001549 [Haemaphysalis longicornis]
MQECAVPEVPGGHPGIREPADIPKGVRVAVRLMHYSSSARLFLRRELNGMTHADGQEYFRFSRTNNHVYDAFVGMACLVCKDSSTGVALRAVVTDVCRNPSGMPLMASVLYVDSGQTDDVNMDCVYTIDVEAAAKPKMAIPCCIRNVQPTAESSRFDLKQLWKHGALFEAVFYTASDAGVYEVDLHAKCLEKSKLKTYDVGKYLVEMGFAQLVDALANSPDVDGSSVQGVVSASDNSGEGTYNGTLERPSAILPACSEPTGDIQFLGGSGSSTVPKKNLKILVTFISSPDQFYGQDVDKFSEWFLVHNLILQSTKKLILKTEIKTGASYIYRELPKQSGARVLVEDVQEHGMCRVFLLDYGNRKTVHFSSLFMAHPKLLCIAPQAMRFQLSDIEPQRAWTEAATNRFVELAHTGTLLRAELVGTKSSHDEFDRNVYTVKLFNPTRGDVAKCMTREGHTTAPRGRSALEPVLNPASPCEAGPEDNNGQLYSNTKDPHVAASNDGAGTDRGISRFHVSQGFCRQDRCAFSKGLRDPALQFEPVIDAVKPLRPPEVGSCVLGQVSAVVSPSCFYLIFPYGRRSLQRLSMEGMGSSSRQMLEILMSDLQADWDRGSFHENRGVVNAVGELVAAKSNIDGRWYRARVVSLEEGDFLTVFYLDFGFCESLPVNQVKNLDARFACFPQQALQACLVTDKGNNRLSDKPTWDDHSCEAFANCVSGRDLVVKIVCVAQGLLHVRLFFTNGGQLCSVRRCLRKSRDTEPN